MEDEDGAGERGCRGGQSREERRSQGRGSRAGRGTARLGSGENSGAAKVPRCREAWARGSQRRVRPALQPGPAIRWRQVDEVDAAAASRASTGADSYYYYYYCCCSGVVGQRTS